MQTKAVFRKEALAFFRTGRFFVLSLVFIGLSALSPLLFSGMDSFMVSMADVADDMMGMDISGMFLSSSSVGVSASVSDLSGIGLIVFLLLINRTAGGEQKKRDVIIPMSAGLRSSGYLFPKYIVYPLAVFVLSVVGMYVSWGVSALTFDVNDVTHSQVLSAGVLTGVYMMMYVCFHITFGTATGRPGLSAAVCIAVSTILPGFFVIADADYMFNPFALNGMAVDIIGQPGMSGDEVRDILITVVFVFALMVLSYFIALFAQNAKKIDNRGNEMEI